MSVSAKALGLVLFLLGGAPAWAKDNRPPHMRFTKPEQVRKWQQFCRKTSDFDLRVSTEDFNNYMVSLGEEGWELVQLDTQVGLVCFKRPAS